MTKELTAQDILESDDRVLEKIEVPQWGGTVWIRSLTASQRDALLQSTVDKATGNISRFTNIRARTVALAVCDSKGQRLFSDGQVEALGRKNSSAIEKVFQAIQKLNGLTPEEVEEMSGNSDGAGSADSPSD